MAAAVRGEMGLRESAARDDAKALRGKRILYVDDDPVIRWATSAFLEEVGITCLVAGTHEQAVRVVELEARLALAILDFHMPDGYVGGLIRRLRSARAGLHLVGTSAADHRMDFVGHGVTQFLEKPWELQDLERVVAASDPGFPRAEPLDPRMPAPVVGD
jgi:DNA-binding NtrC family response regulator